MKLLEVLPSISFESDSVGASILSAALLHAVNTNNPAASTTSFFIVFSLFNYSSAYLLEQAFFTQISNDFVKYTIDE